MSFNMETSIYMNMAVKEAKKALVDNEVPVGCVFVRNDTIVCKSHNLTNKLRDPLAHAEIVGIRATDCRDCYVFITCEPCVMCYGILVRLNCRVYFGCYNPIFGCSLLLTNNNVCFNSQICIDLLKKFYSQENHNSPIEKRKIKQPKNAIADG